MTADPCGTGSDLGRTAYEAESAWLDQFAPGGHSAPWDSLDPEHRGVYQRIAAAVAAAERERILAAASSRKVRLSRPGYGYRAEEHAEYVPWAVLAEVLGVQPDGTQPS